MYTDGFFRYLVEEEPRKAYGVGTVSLSIKYVHGFKKMGLEEYDSFTDELSANTTIFEVKKSEFYIKTINIGNFEWIKALVCITIQDEMKELRLTVYKDGQLTLELVSEGGISDLSEFTRYVYLFLEGLRKHSLPKGKIIRQKRLFEDL